MPDAWGPPLPDEDALEGLASLARIRNESPEFFREAREVLLKDALTKIQRSDVSDVMQEEMALRAVLDHSPPHNLVDPESFVTRATEARPADGVVGTDIVVESDTTTHSGKSMPRSGRFLLGGVLVALWVVGGYAIFGIGEDLFMALCALGIVLIALALGRASDPNLRWHRVVWWLLAGGVSLSGLSTSLSAINWRRAEPAKREEISIELFSQSVPQLLVFAVLIMFFALLAHRSEGKSDG